MLTPFTGIRSFMKAPLIHSERSRFAIVGAPTDMATTFRTGARMAPAAIREASLMLCDGDHPWYENDPVGQGLVWDAGDIDPVINDPRATRERLFRQLAFFQYPIVLGGDHSITLQTLQAAYAKHGQLALVHFDAHVDTWETDNGVGNHGTFLREAIDLGFVDPERTVQIGIRSPMPAALREWGRQKGITVMDARAVHNSPNLNGLGKSLAYSVRTGRYAQSDKSNPPTFLTFDIDCLDPSVAPGTGTPEPGGLFMHQVMEIMDGMSGLNYVGMDLVEVLPAHDNNDITAICAANIVWNHICQQAQKS